MKATAAAAKHAHATQHDVDLLHGMLRIRRFEERSAELYSLGKIRGFLHLYIGEEAIAVGAMQALSADDAVVATYREHGQALARGVPAGPVMAEMFGKVTGCSRGRGGSMHLFDADRRFYGGYAIVGGGLPIAAGLALADRLRGRHAVTACFFGDGAVVEGEFHEVMNLSVLWRLPVLFLCENNGYAMGTALERSHAVTDLRKRAAAYGMRTSRADGMDVRAVERTVRKAAGGVRTTGEPAFVELLTYRFRAHSMSDPDLYRTKEEIERWMERDPVAHHSIWLRERGVSDEQLAEVERQVAEEIDAAVAFAEAGEWEPLDGLTRDVYTEDGAP
jgi:pyruvate dehydrogenase E1 component alpha subunit